MIGKLCILGPGLLGASLALAAKERGLAGRVSTWSRRAETRARCHGQAWCDEVAESAAGAVEGADWVVLCTPVTTIVPLLKSVGDAIQPGAIVTDVGSTKSRIVRGARHVLREAVFIGSHPMAGSEQTGMEHARADLFENAACFVTPLPEDDTAKVAQVVAFWKALGMIVSTTSPETHDEIVAHISHLPHLLASSLCAYLDTRPRDWQALAGNGLRDTTRVASGDAGLWREILSENREEVLRAIDGFESELHLLKQALLNREDHSVTAFLERGKLYRDRMRPGSPQQNPAISQ